MQTLYIGVRLAEKSVHSYAKHGAECLVCIQFCTVYSVIKCLGNLK